MKKQQGLYLSEVREKFHKTQLRLENAISSGRFYKMSRTRQEQLFERLKRYATRLGAAIKPALMTAMVAAGLLVGSGANAQTFVEKTGSMNPLNGKTVSGQSMPAFVDIDNDGDKDLYAGQYYSDILNFVNTGSASAPAFGSGDQISYYGVFNAAPALVDIDNDGDQDIFEGTDGGKIFFYPNTGTAGSPLFDGYPVDQTPIPGYTNPLAGIDVGSYATPAFVDIDNDGVIDLFIGNSAGKISFYKNTGTVTAPVFALQSGVNDPFNGITIPTGRATPAFGDIDKDGDFDVVVGNAGGTFSYFKNTGLATAPVFTLITGVSNPFDALTVSGGFSAPALVDINDDGNLDLFSGNDAGEFQFFQNTSALPVQLLSFTARLYNTNKVLVDWSTAQEQNSRNFVVQHSNNATAWHDLGTLAAAGNSSNTKNYSFIDQSPSAGINYYRLLQTDLDGTKVFSAIKTVNLAGISGEFVIMENPVVTGNLRLQVNSDLMLGIYDSKGRLILKKKLTTGINLLNTTNYPKGVYFIRGARQIEKFIVQ